MFWRRKGWLRREFDQQIITVLSNMRDEWKRRKNLVEKSVEPSEEILVDLKIVEAKYFFLIKEAKQRRITIQGVR